MEEESTIGFRNLSQHNEHSTGLYKNIVLRGDFRDYLTTFARRQIVPAANGTARGIFQQFTPFFGVSYTF